jgi:small-conductance mechanosensitive channel
MRNIVTSQLLATIYDTLNQNNIEIPFPQQDVHIKS